MSSKEYMEAPASVTYSLTNPSGFPILFTVRGKSGTELLMQMVLIEKSLTEKGYKPQQKASFSKPIPKIVGKCPKCGSDAVETKKKDGTVYQKCSTNKWNKEESKYEGCNWTSLFPYKQSCLGN